MTVVNHDTGEIVETIAADEARRLTTEAQNEFRSSREHFDRAWALIEEAVNGGGHLVLGYRSPSDYLHAEFDGVLSGLDVPARRTAVRTMTAWGLSTRAIAKPLGIGKSQVAKDQRQVSTAGHPPQTPEPVEEGEADAGSGQTPQGEAAPGDDASRPVPSDSPPRPAVTGIDGKTYAKAKPKKPVRKPLADAFFRAAYDLGKKAESLHRLIEDDRWPQNAEKVATAHRNDLLRINDLLQQVINAMPEQESTT